jgi:hypothetical protein
MDVLPLLADGSCSITGTCATAPDAVHGRCPQLNKCGTCVAWSPREENGYGRNSGQCMLDRDSKSYLDCNAAPCPYYRPRRESPAYEAWLKAPRAEEQKARRGPKRSLNREAPPPSAAALAQAAFGEHPADVAEAGAPVLAALLEAHGSPPVLLERFRGGSASLRGPWARDTSVEAFFARLALLRRSLDGLEAALEASALAPEERDKIAKDLAGIGGSLTTFNFLFRDKADHFRGQGKG